jgi:Methylase involved in ubiquinone/menaquinone biosynthesis
MSRTVEEELFMDSVRSLAAGTMLSRMLELAFSLEVFEKLSGKELALPELAETLGLPIPSARLLGQFLCREGLLLLRHGKLSNSPLAEKFLASPGKDRKALNGILRLQMDVGALKQRLLAPPPLYWHQVREQGDVTDTSALIQANAQENWLASFFASNHNWRIQFGEDLASRYDFSNHQLLLDIGGATGGWCIGIRKLNPHLRCVVFDLPNARESAEQGIQEAEASDWITFHEGSFFSDPLPRGADVALLASILHNWSIEDGRTILRKAFEALQHGGALIVKEYFFEDDWQGPMEAVFDAFVMLGQEGKSGWQPSYGEVEELMREAGFTNLERKYNLVMGRKP